MSNFTARTFIAVFCLLGLTILAYPILAQSDEPCQVISGGVDEATGDKVSITICKDDLGGQVTEEPTPVGTPTVTPTATPVAPTSTPVVLPTLVPGPQSSGLWLSVAEVKALPTTGAWSSVQSAASSGCNPDLANQDSSCNVTILANALAWARTDDPKYRQHVVDAIRSIVQNESENGGRTLALARELGAYVAAADMIGLSTFDPQLHQAFVARLRGLRGEVLDGMTLVQMHERRPNNWGTNGCAARAAIDVYIGDATDLGRTAQVFRGWLGDRGAYAGFTYGDLSWQADPAAPVGINKPGTTRQGHSIDGALPDDMRRGGSFRWPPAPTGYAWGGLSGAFACAEILYRAGFDVYNWQDRALLRAVRWLNEDVGWQAQGDDAWAVALANKRYGVSYPVDGTAPGKNMGWTQWTHQGVQAAQDVTVIDDTYLVATGESAGDLADEVEYLAQFGWMPVGNVYELDTDDGRVYAQDMERN